MGGIAGIKYFERPSNIDDPQLIERMLESMKHRAPYFRTQAPDHSGCYGAMHLASKNNDVMAYNAIKDILVIVDGTIFNIFDKVIN